MNNDNGTDHFKDSTFMPDGSHRGSENLLSNDPHEHEAGSLAEQIGKAFEGDSCLYCKKPLEVNEEDPDFVPICDACDRKETENAEKARKDEEKKRIIAREKSWIDLSGGYAETWQTVEDWIDEKIAQFDPRGRRGITITGPGANLILWAFLHRVHEEGVKFESRLAGGFRSEIMSLRKHGDDTPTLKVVLDAPVLAIESFGTQASTAAGDELFSVLLEKRTRAGRPTLISTPYEGKELKSKFIDDGIAQTILSAIGRDFAEVIKL